MVPLERAWSIASSEREPPVRAALIRTVLIGLRSRFYEQKRDLVTLVSPSRFVRGMKRVYE